MHLLSKKDYAKVIPIYDAVENSRPVIFSVIDGNMEGTVYADNAENPQTALVMLFDMLFFAGKQNAAFCKAALDLLTREVFPKMDERYFDCYCLSGELRQDIEALFGGMITGRPIRKTWTFTKEAFAQQPNWRDSVPDGFRMARMDEAFITAYHCDRNYWHPAAKRFGYALVCGDEIVCECTACFVGGGQAEITVDTKEPYQRRGFATITCTAFIEHSLSLGLLPNWSCWDFRTASIALARRLGFRENTDDVVYGLTKAENS